LSERVRLPSAEDRFWGGNRKKVLALFAGTLFWEEPEKQRADVPQDAGETPSVCRVSGEHILLERVVGIRSNNERGKISRLSSRKPYRNP